MIFRILLIGSKDVQITGEVRYLTSLDNIRVTVLANGDVHARTIYEACRRQRFDAIHFAVHSDERKIIVNGDILNPEDIAQLARLCRATLVFFNSCVSGRLSSYVTRHGVDFSICNNTPLADEDAWKTPLAFYDFINSQIAASGTFSIAEAYDESTPDDGEYGIYINHQRSRIVLVQARLDRLERVAIALGLVDILTLVLVIWLAVKAGIVP